MTDFLIQFSSSFLVFPYKNNKHMKQSSLKIAMSVAIALAMVCSSCSITDKSKLGGFATLETWKQAADSAQSQHSPDNKADYVNASKAVERAISVKKQEALALSESWLPIGKVDGSMAALDIASPGIEKQVQRALNMDQMAAPAIVEGATVVAELAEYLRKAAVEGRKNEAEALNKRLESYKWKMW